MDDEASDAPGLRAATDHCRLEEIVAYRAGDLASEQALVFEAHLKSCGSCVRLVSDAVNVLTDVDGTIQAANSRVNQVDLILARLRRKVAERVKRPVGWTPRQPSQRFWLPVAGVVLVLILVAALQMSMVMLPALWRNR